MEVGEAARRDADRKHLRRAQLAHWRVRKEYNPSVRIMLRYSAVITGSLSDRMAPSVAAPPKDQQHVDRLGLLYFSR